MGCFSSTANRPSAAEQTQYNLCVAGVSDKSALCECAKTAYQSKICANETCKSGLEYLNELGIDVGEVNAYGYSINSQCSLSCDDDKKSSAGVIIGVIIGVLVVLAIVVALVVMQKRKAAASTNLPPPE